MKTSFITSRFELDGKNIPVACLCVSSISSLYEFDQLEQIIKGLRQAFESSCANGEDVTSINRHNHLKKVATSEAV